jgi:hypothetical protein
MEVFLTETIMPLGIPGSTWQASSSALQKEAQAAVAIASAVAVAALAVGVGHVVARLRERRKSHSISNQLLSQVFPGGIK